LYSNAVLPFIGIVPLYTSIPTRVRTIREDAMELNNGTNANSEKIFCEKRDKTLITTTTSSEVVTHLIG